MFDSKCKPDTSYLVRTDIQPCDFDRGFQDAIRDIGKGHISIVILASPDNQNKFLVFFHENRKSYILRAFFRSKPDYASGNVFMIYVYNSDAIPIKEKIHEIKQYIRWELNLI